MMKIKMKPVEQTATHFLHCISVLYDTDMKQETKLVNDIYKPVVIMFVCVYARLCVKMGMKA